MRRALFFLLLLTSVPAAAEMWIEPPDPTTRTAVSLNVVDFWHDGCLPLNPVVTRTGNTIEVVWTVRGGGCPQAVTEWRDRVELGLFEAGDYQIEPKVRLQGGMLQSYPTQTLTVRDAAPRFIATPRYTSTRGGEDVSIVSEDFCGGVNVVVSIDGTEVASRRGPGSCEVLVTMPAHPAGPADVTLRSGGVSRTWLNVIRYADPDAAPDRALAERILVPIIFSGPGAFGSQWVTEASVTSRMPFEWHRFRPCSTAALCGTRVSSQNPASLVTMFGQRPKGLLLFVDRYTNGLLFTDHDHKGDLHFGSLIRDVSRDGTHGTEVPVVRESEFLTGYTRMPNVTLDPSYRATLRIYGVDGVLENVYVDAHAPGRASMTWFIERLPSPCNAVPCNSDEPAYVSLDLTSEFRTLAGAGPVSIGVEPDHYSPRRYWAFITVTHNETQRVTVITPQ